MTIETKQTVRFIKKKVINIYLFSSLVYMGKIQLVR